jgi:hypothetical protein
MNISLRKWFIYTVSVALLTASSLVMASGNHDDDDDDDGYHFNGNICKKTADKMLKSCRNEVKEEYYAEKAKCMNLADDDLEDRDECLQEVKQARKENKKLCGDQREARKNLCNLLPDREASGYGPEAFLTAGNFVADPGRDAVNPYFSLAPGHTYVAEVTGGVDDEGNSIVETVVVTVTEETITVVEDEGPGVVCRLVVDIVLVDGEPVEVTDDYYAQALNGDVHYCGEVARNFEDGHLVDLDGSFLVGRDGAKSGTLIKASPLTGEVHRQEWLLGEAEDAITYVAGADAPTWSAGDDEGGENPHFKCSESMTGCVKSEEFIPPEPDAGEYKYFIADVGFVLGVALEDGEPTGEREELLCTGDSIAGVLNECDIDEIRDDLCDLSNAFCEE